jgi:hypothetical protein
MRSITMLPLMMCVNIGITTFARGTNEFRMPCRRMAWASVNPFVLARSMKSEFIVFCQLCPKIPGDPRYGPSDRAMIGSVRLCSFAKPLAEAS